MTAHDRPLHSLLAALELCLVAAALLAPGPAAAASVCSGANGKVAVVLPAPDGYELGFLTRAQQFRKIYKVKDEGRRGAPYSIEDPSFSCDGRRVAFTEVGGKPWRALVVLDLTSGKAHRVATHHRYGEHPAFLSDGRIVFSSRNVRRVPGSNLNKSHPGGTFVVNADGSHFRRLFARRELTVSANGRWFVSVGPGDSSRKLELLNAQGHRVRVLAKAKSHTEYEDPQISPGGGRIVFARKESGHGVLFTVRRDGTHLRRLTRGSRSAFAPAFSPDGRWVVFVRTLGETAVGQIYALPLSHAQNLKKLSLSSAYQAPAWAPR